MQADPRGQAPPGGALPHPGEHLRLEVDGDDGAGRPRQPGHGDREIAEAAAEVQAAVARADQEPAPGEWSAKETLAHLIHNERHWLENLDDVILAIARNEPKIIAALGQALPKYRWQLTWRAKKPCRAGFATAGPPLSRHSIAKCPSCTDQLIDTEPLGPDSAPYLAALVASSCNSSASVRASFGSRNTAGPSVLTRDASYGRSSVSALSCLSVTVLPGRIPTVMRDNIDNTVTVG